MVKFSKQFEGQLVPEWKHAFVDYCMLKKDLKRMHHALVAAHDDHSDDSLTISTQQTARQQAEEQSSYLSRWLFHSWLPVAHLFGSNAPRDQGVIHVRRRLTGPASRGGGGDVYETELLAEEEQLPGRGGGDTGGTAERDFFARLDAQLNKVNQFYRGKEEEFLERGRSLRRQMDILAGLKAAREEDESSTRYVTATATDRTDQQEEREPMLMEDAAVAADQPAVPVPETKGPGRSASGCGSKSLEINIPVTTPSRAISALTDVLWDELAAKKCGPDGSGGGQRRVDKRQLRHAEKMIRGAFVELYKGLGYLATYRNLNMMAFVKILKKFEKITGKQVLYLRAVETSYFNTSDEALKLMDEVEDIFVRRFAGDNLRKAMTYLRPAQQRKDESHAAAAAAFFTGLATGCLAALLVANCVTARAAGLYSSYSHGTAGAAAAAGARGYMETAYPVGSALALLFLHLLLYGCDMVAWRRCRVNYGFIFGPGGGRGLRPRDVFLLCAASMAAVAGVMLAHLALLPRGHHASPSPRVQAIPGFLLLVFLLLLFCPFNVVYRWNRFQFLKTMRNNVFSPLYKVVMVDFFMADQLCSQVPMIRSLEYLAWYYISGSYRTQEYGYCTNAKHIRDLAYAVSFLPYYWRAMQCARRWFDEGDASHLVNLGKYASAMLAAGAKVAYEKDKSPASLSLLVAASGAATVYQLYWDFVKDWGLLQPGSKNPWLRDDLVVKTKSIYYLSMGLNLVLRLAWLQTVIHPNFGSLNYRVTSFFLAALEVIRRGHWNFYRLENEHLNNVGKSRAVNTVPLPFHEVDEY